MVDIQPLTEDFEKEIKAQRTNEQPDGGTAKVVPAPPNTNDKNMDPTSSYHGLDNVPAYLLDDTNDSSKMKKNSHWLIESVFINIFAILNILVAVYVALPILIGASSPTVKFSIGLFYGIEAFIALQILRRSDMARRVIVIFMIINILIQLAFLLISVLFPWIPFNIIPVIVSLGVIIFFSSDAIKRHF
jgi:hypothetical protein